MSVFSEIESHFISIKSGAIFLIPQTKIIDFFNLEGEGGYSRNSK